MDAPTGLRDRAFVLFPDLGKPLPGARTLAEKLEEACGLAEALDLSVAAKAIETMRRVDSGAFLSKGKVQIWKEKAEAEHAQVLVLDAALSPSQQRNLEKALGIKVIDRTGLILEIFGLRAQTKEGRLQVELARLGYERSRLVKTWTHLERQRGGLGAMGGPGETQLEIDKRLIDDKIVRLKSQLEEVRRTRGLQRKSRERRRLPVVALGGYTNAGKSTLFNRLTGAQALAKNMLFATLDPALRKIKLPGGEAVLADTVGFIADLPTELVAAFRATLEEVLEADLILHVRDISHPETDAQAADVRSVLDALCEGGKRSLPPVREVWNKMDLLEARGDGAFPPQTPGQAAPIPVSARDGTGLDRLCEEIARAVLPPKEEVEISIPADRADLQSILWRECQVLTVEPAGENELLFRFRADAPVLARLMAAIDRNSA